MDTNNTTTTTNDPVDQFLNQILDEKKITGDSPDIRPQLVQELRVQLMNQIDRAMINALQPEQLDQLNDLLDNEGADDQQVQDFFRNSGVDGQQVALDTMLRFRSLYLGVTA